MPRRSILRFFIIAAAISAATASDVVHNTPRDHLKKRNPVKGVVSHQTTFLPIYNWEQTEYLNAHNELRRKIGVPPLSWSGELTAAAHFWAEQRRGDCNYRLHSPNHYGENIFWMSYKEFTPRDVVQWWFDESRLYDPDHLVCRCKPERNGCECGHYLNIIWSTTKRVGCSGAVYCDDQKGVFVVCNYDPPGLIPGINPFNGHGITS